METLIPFVVAVFALLLVPGPDMALVAASGVAYGRRGALYSALGIGTGGLVLTAATALVVAAATGLNTELVRALQMMGAAYLIWLSVSVLRHPAGDDDDVAPPVSDGNLFVRGVLTNLANPKALVFFLAFLPQFIPVGSTSPALAAVWLGMLLCVIGTSVNFAIGVTGVALAGLAGRRIANRSVGQWVIGIVFFVIGAGFMASLV